MERWATFDCYGTLIDWEGGIRDALTRLWPEADGERLLARFHQIEPVVQEGSAMPYREVLERTLRAIAREDFLELDEADAGALAESLPSWRAFPEVPGALREMKSRGWRFAILSNTDPDLLAASILQLEVEPDLSITAAEAGSYKPAHRHWEVFRAMAAPEPAGHVHVAASLFHDIRPAQELGIPAVWINRLGEDRGDLAAAAELTDLEPLPDILDRLVSG
jgi:2-haloacid dehalogenase